MEDKKKLFVRNLSYQTKEDELEEYFEKFGKVQSVTIISRDGRSKGMGFVEFETSESAKKALAEGEGELDGRNIGLSWAEDKKREGGSSSSNIKTKIIYVGNLSYKSTEDSIREFFGDCGEIDNVRIATKQDGKMKGFCHVTFEDESSVDKALGKNGEDLDGRNVKVDKPLPRQEGGRGDFRDRRGGRGGRGRGGFRGGRGGFRRGGRD